MEDIRQSTGAWIPSFILDDNDLDSNEKILYAKIVSLSEKHGYCWASNEWFSKYIGVSERSISNFLKKITIKGLVSMEMETTETGRRRVIKLDHHIVGRVAKTATPMSQKGNWGYRKEQQSTLYSDERIRKDTIANANIIPVLPFQSENFLKAWQSWDEHRKQKKQRLTPKTIEMQLKKLGALSEVEAIEMIEQSITNGWTGIFEVKKNSNGKFSKQFDVGAAVSHIYGNSKR